MKTACVLLALAVVLAAPLAVDSPDFPRAVQRLEEKLDVYNAFTTTHPLRLSMSIESRQILPEACDRIEDVVQEAHQELRKRRTGNRT